MRLRDFPAAPCHLLALTLLVACAASSHAQFRELPADQVPQTTAPGTLVPTRQPFVAPHTITTPAATPSAANTGGLPATPQPVAAEPTPALQEAGPSPSDVSAAAPQASPTVQPMPRWDAFQPAARSKHADAVAAPSPEMMPEVVTFNQVEPGVTTVEQLRETWGEPSKSRVEGASQVLVYAVPGFRQVDVHVDESGKVVQSLLIHLAASVSVEELQPHLGLEWVNGVDVTDEEGEVLGRGYPERGVLLTCVDGDGTQRVTHVSLEPIGAELYRLRAEYDYQNRLTRSLTDLDEAIRRDPQDAHAHWLRAELLSLIGRSRSALQSADMALQLDVSQSLYRLTQARISAELGELEDALRATRSVADNAEATEIVRARADYQLGNLVAIGPEPDFQQALTHHMRAIDRAAKHMADRRVQVRRMAKDILVDAHLAVAQDIALGDFQRQREVVPKWLVKATELAEEFIAHDHGDETMRMEIFRTTLAVYSVLDGNFDAAAAAEESLQEGRRLIAQSNDELYQHRVERELSEGLYYAARVEHHRGKAEQALLHVNNAVALLEGQPADREPTLFDQIMTGQLYFLVGSLHAMHEGDHAEAVRWYDKAQPLFDRDGLEQLVHSESFGDLFVSMGVSYWETGAKDSAVQLTQLGAELMQNAVQAGRLELSAMTVPYGNLAAMYSDLGDQKQAKHYAAMLAKVDQGQKSR